MFRAPPISLQLLVLDSGSMVDSQVDSHSGSELEFGYEMEFGSDSNYATGSVLDSGSATDADSATDSGSITMEYIRPAISRSTMESS